MSDLIATLAMHVQHDPDRVALVDGDEKVTLSQLWQKVRALAFVLSNAGVKHGDRVAIIGPNTQEWVQVYLAAMASGAVAVPLNPDLRPGDLSALIKHAGANVVFVDISVGVMDKLAAQLPDVMWLTKQKRFTEHCVALSEIEQEFAPEISGALTDLGCILYTSGTSGAPKGVMLSHVSILQNALDVADYLQLSGTDVSLALLPFYYSFGNSVLVTHLLSGSRLVFGASLMYPEKLMALVDAEGVTGLAGVPTLFQLLLKRDLLSDIRWRSLRYVAQAGGALSASTAERLSAALPWCRIFVMYGQTEATARICYLSPEYLLEKPGSVGWPLPDTCVQIRDEVGDPLSAGEVGQIWVRGPGLMLGYWRNKQATDKVLVDGWLCTGDMGEMDGRGFLYIRGRRSDMLKVSGQRLHPQEIEAVINELPEVAECAVDGVDDDVVGQVPRVFVVLKPGAELADQALLRYCRSQLVGWKVPRYVEVIGALPKTGSGKIQRNLLSGLLSQGSAITGSEKGNL
jgi:long-chain acyl-CoA synthetase